MELGFERAKEEHLLDAMPTVHRLVAGRVKLDVLGLELDEKRASPSSHLSVGNNEWSAKLAADLSSLVLRAGRKELSMKLAPNLRSLGLRAGLDEELTVKIAPDHQCEMGVRLAADAQGFSVVVRPRYTLNERKQGLVAQELEKDLTRARSQFADNQLDLAKAQAQLKAIPKELEQLRKAKPESPQEYAYLQARMENLRGMGAKSEATARRIAPLLPRMASDIERIEVLLILVGEMSNRLRLRFRVVAGGEVGDLVLFETASGTSPLQ